MEANLSCTLCPRSCNINRMDSTGFCGVNNKIKVARYSLHMWEEPCISGNTGSGTIFFSGCNLGCIYCQNHLIAHRHLGTEIEISDLSRIMLKLEKMGASNINLVTPSHYADMLPQAIYSAREKGLTIPIAYNTSSYENVSVLKKLRGFIDIYMPDLKYLNPENAKKYSFAPDYPEIAKAAIAEMINQTGAPEITSTTRLMKKGVIVRHLILPMCTNDSKNIVRYLYETYGDTIYISIMNQYTPVIHLEKYPELNRKVTKREYDKVLSYALELGIKNCFFQEGDVAEASFIPDFSKPLNLD